MRTVPGRMFLAMLVPLAMLVACSPSPLSRDSRGSGTAVTLRVGQLRSNLEPLLAAAGQLKDLPYRIQWSTFNIGPDAIAAESAGSVDVSYMADTPPIFAQAAKVPVKIVGLTRAPDGARNVALLVRRGSAIGSVADLAGKRVAVLPGTVTQYLLIRALAQAGLTLSDVDQVNLQGPESIAALADRDVSSVALVDPLLATALIHSKARVLLNGSKLLSGSSVLVATQQTLADPGRAKSLGDLLRRVQRALIWARDHPREWAAIYGETYHLPTGAARQATQRSATVMVTIDHTAVMAQQQQADTFTSIGLLKEHLDVTQEFDNRYNGMLLKTKWPGRSKAAAASTGWPTGPDATLAVRIPGSRTSMTAR
jgi:sulfonate transport system substrate-binding protein